ncbi:flagellar hook assembly protein FlgD [Thioalkalivibrio sp. ALJ24]|uniref:flagellar hook assembly protein FlgD n=1 Tax=Thioalkalivibrio sp. ALJ24 TaxID=545276 RepID=UPI00036D0EE8|nr:flagellar hook assembly protein FlgD [Thioalkalivibrio sp. ALJ24]
MNGLTPDMLEGAGIRTDRQAQRDRQATEGPNDELGQEDFLKLMTTQLQNQDPFEPMENGDFIAQMAQFSSVTGIQQLNESFEGFAQSMGQNQAVQGANLVGKDVLVPVEFGQLGPEGGMSGAFELGASAESVELEILNGAGERVRSMNLGAMGAGLQDFQWDGLTDNGQHAPPGVYEVRATARSGESTESLETFLNQRVDSVSMGGGKNGLALNVQGVGEIDFSDVRRISG